MHAPTIAELSQNPLVLQALENAWTASLSHDPRQRHEEGGWIVMDITGGTLTAIQASAGGLALLDLSAPPLLAGTVVVATFHTHPNPIAQGWEPGPSLDDTESAWELGVPCLIRAEDGIHTTGPDSRRGGLTGGSGFPP
jgi:hypothetical protein